MTNEELLMHLQDGREDVLTELCQKNAGLIHSRAEEMAKQYNCIRTDVRSGKLSSYTTTLLEDLCGEGWVAFIACLRSGNYDSNQGALTTFVTPHIDSAMRRYLETSLGSLSLSRSDMTLVRKVQQAYYKESKSASEIGEMLHLSTNDVMRHLRYATHFYGLEDARASGESWETFTTRTPDQIVYDRIRTEYLKELFDALPNRDRDILGKCYGVFGCTTESLREIGMYHGIKPDAVEKAKRRALTKLRSAYPDSKMHWWNTVHRMIDNIVQENNGTP